jgi:hypothetical protein
MGLGKWTRTVPKSHSLPEASDLIYFGYRFKNHTPILMTHLRGKLVAFTFIPRKLSFQILVGEARYLSTGSESVSTTGHMAAWPCWGKNGWGKLLRSLQGRIFFVLYVFLKSWILVNYATYLKWMKLPFTRPSLSAAVLCRLLYMDACTQNLCKKSNLWYKKEMSL